MGLESIVTSLELSQKLDKIGIKQESLFYWGASENPLASIFKETDVPIDRWRLIDTRQWRKESDDWAYSAFTAQELWNMIESKYLLEIRVTVDSDIVAETGSFCGYEQSCNLANCLAQLIIAQKESGNDR